jgi:serine/threonine protein kinase/tetratricopeptide (TPR) repeat protein
MTASDAPLDEAEELYAQWRRRSEGGQAEPFSELMQRHPELRERLERIAEADRLIRQGLRGGEPPGGAVEPRRAPGRLVGDFLLLREIGRGGMGIVFEAEQISLRRRVALKILPAHSTLDERARARFRQEAEIAGRLRHPGLVDVHQVGELDGVHFMAMELVAGAPLAELIERMRSEAVPGARQGRITNLLPVCAPATAGPPGSDGARREASGQHEGARRKSTAPSSKSYIESVVKLVIQVADALDHAHRHGVLHRDVKPSNILVRPDGTPVLTDFGLARQAGLPHLTQTGEFAGTPHYVAPEQAVGGGSQVDARADVFSLGATLYELLTLQHAFPGRTVHEVLGRILMKDPVSPQRHNPALAADLVTIVLKSLEKQPASRYQSMGAFADDLRAFIEYRPIQARPIPAPARALRWARREPLKAAFAAVLALGVPSTLLLLTEIHSTSGELAAKEGEIAAQERELQEQLLEQAFLELGLDEPRAAERIFRGALERWPDSVDGRAGLVLALLRQGRPGDSLKALAAWDRLSTLERLRVAALREFGDPEGAAALERSLAEPATALERYLEGLRLLGEIPVGADVQPHPGYRREEALDSVSLLEAAVEADPGRALYAFGLALACNAERDPGRAGRVAAAIVERWGIEAMAWFYAGMAREAIGPQEALRSYQRALELDPSFAPAEERAAILLGALGDAEAALERMRALVQRHPGVASHQANLAFLLWSQGRFPEAVEAARQAVQLDPLQVKAYDTLGQSLFTLGRAEEARDAFEKAVELEPTAPWLQNDLGAVLLELGDGEGARECLKQALSLDPGFPLPACSLAALHLRANEPGLALDSLVEAFENQAARGDRDFPREQALNMLADACQRLVGAGRAEECLDQLQRILAAEPRLEQAHVTLSEVLSALGRHEEALKAARRGSELVPDGPLVWNQLAWLQVDPRGAPALRDAAQGLRAAEQALRLSDGMDPAILDTHAWALHWNQETERAARQSARALELARDRGMDARVVKELERSQRAFREALGE